MKGASTSGRFLSLLRAHTEHDFRAYKAGTLHRRIQRRMGLRHVTKVDAYLDLLRSDPEEVSGLFTDLLISVTRFLSRFGGHGRS